MNPSSLFQSFQPKGLDGIILLSPVARRYVSGFSSSDGAVVLWENGGALLTDFRYIEAAQKQVHGLDVIEVQSGQQYTAVIQELVQKHQIQTVGFEEEFLSFAQYGNFQKKLTAKLEPMGAWLTQLRQIKSKREVDAIVSAQRIAEKAFEEICEFIRPHVTEKEIAARLTYDMLRFGAEKLSFDPIVASGIHGSMPHATPTAKPIKKGEMITMDFGCIVDGYCSDMTRTVAVGAIGEEQEHIYQVVLEAQEAGILAARPGLTGEQLDSAARNVIEKAGFGSCFGHSFGHGIGLEIHEAPSVSSTSQHVLQEGEVISAEPGIYVPRKFGVRIEDMLLLTKDGSENLTKAPKDLRYL